MDLVNQWAPPLLPIPLTLYLVNAHCPALPTMKIESKLTISQSLEGRLLFAVPKSEPAPASHLPFLEPDY